MDSTRTAVRPVVDRRDARAADEIGRTARLELAFAVRGGRTVLAHSYAEPPFRVGHAFAEGDGLHLILTSSAPGIFGGDRLAQSITVERNARVRLTSQSATQVHPSRERAEAVLNSQYRVEAGGSLSCEWDPLIPFPGARFEQRIAIDVAQDAALFWSDALMGGREARGERWLFDSMSHELRVVQDRELRYMERYRVRPGDAALLRTWAAGDACYFGTVLSMGRAMETFAPGDLHARLQGIDGVRAAVDRLDGVLTLVRLTATAGVAFREARAVSKSV